MDSEFVSRYLREPQSGGEGDVERGETEPVSRPQPPAAPSVEEPRGPDTPPSPDDERTNVLPRRTPQAQLPPPPYPGVAQPSPAGQPTGVWAGEPPRPLVAQPDPPARETPRGVAADAAQRMFDPAPHQHERPVPGPAEPRRDASSAPRWSMTPERATPAPGSSPWRPASETEHTPSWQSGAGQHLRVDELVKSRKLPPEMGWRKTVYVGTGHLVNLGAGPAEQRLRDQIGTIGTNIPGNYQIAVISVTGGIGKTRTTAGVGTAFATYRSEPVLAVDANPTYGNLGRLIDPHASASIREFMADAQMTTYPKARSYTGKNQQGLEVLAGNQNMANPLALSSRLFGDTLTRTRRFYQLALIDCGPDIEHPAMEGVFSAVDALVIVGSMNFDGAMAAEQTIDWLATRNAHELLRRSVVVLNDVYHCADKKFVTSVRNSLGPRVGEVMTVPWDAHLRDGAVLDFEALRRPTQLAYIELASWLAQGFATAGAAAR